MTVSKGGTQFGFCPGKATWDPEAINLFRVCVLSSEMKTLPFAGSLMEQPDWVIDLMSWFVPAYDNVKFASRARSVLGSGSATKPAPKPALKGKRRG